MALFSKRSNTATASEVVAPDTAPSQVSSTSQPGQRKAGPTRSRRVAEAERRARVNPHLSKKEAKARQAQQARLRRTRAMEARDGAVEKVLLRDWVDSRRNLGEFLLPSLVVLLAVQFLSTAVRDLLWITTLIMYAFLALVIFDIVRMWRGFKRLLAERLPSASTKGLLMYGAMRSTQIRRFRMPPPRVARGEKI